MDEFPTQNKVQCYPDSVRQMRRLHETKVVVLTCGRLTDVGGQKNQTRSKDCREKSAEAIVPENREEANKLLSWFLIAAYLMGVSVSRIVG